MISSEIKAINRMRRSMRAGLRSLGIDPGVAPTSHPLFQVWRGMTRRCIDPRANQYADYGGRGIAVCERWRDFMLFVHDMQPGYRPGLTLDRINNDEGYSPANCRWASRQEQNRNSRRNRIVETPQGPMALAAAAEAYGVSYSTISKRVKRGVPPDRLLIPSKPKTVVKRYGAEPSVLVEVEALPA